MAVQEKIQRKTQAKEVEQVAEIPKPEKKSGEELKSEMDNLLDEIEGVLEENAEAFVKNYTQQGGE